MGLFYAMRRSKKLTSFSTPVVASGMVSPHSGDRLASIVWHDHFKTETGDITRNGAMRIPAIVKARNLLAGMIGGLPLQQYDGETLVDAPWLYRTESDVSPWHRMAYTLDDLLFHGWSLWLVSREADRIVDAVRVPFERWDADADGTIRVDGALVRNEEVIVFPGAFEGILQSGADTITGAHALQRAWVGRAKNPIPLIELHQVTDDELDDDEIDALIETWANARNSPNGAVGWTDRRVELKTHGTVPTDLFEQGRNAIVLDVARLTSIPAALLEGSQSTATLTYSTQEGQRNEFAEYSLPIWTSPIEQRLSMDDVCPAGQRIRFDLSRFTSTVAPSTNPPIED